MGLSVGEAVVPLCDLYGRTAGVLRIASAGKKPPHIRLLTAEEQREYGEERVQLFEGRRYEYVIEGASKGYHLQEDGIVSRSALPEGEGRGTIEPGSYTGLLPVRLVDPAGQPAATAALEVVTTKLDYRRHYRWMLEYLADQCADLVADIKAPTLMRLSPNFKRISADSLAQRFHFVRSFLDARGFHEAIGHILSVPYRELKLRREEQALRSPWRPDAEALREFANARPRVRLPNKHPLALRMSSLGVEVPSVPRRVSVPVHEETTDTPENRFVKHALNMFRNFLAELKSAVANDRSQAGKRLLAEIERHIGELNTMLSDEFFRHMGEPVTIPVGSPVLQGRSGYRELYRTWLKFFLSANLVWEGGDDVYGAGKKDVAKLYEYWVFFQLISLIARRFDLARPPSRSLLEERRRGIGLKLKSGRQVILEGLYRRGTRRLQVRLAYNRTFSFSSDHTETGSWTRGMKPDFTLALWPDKFTEEEAARQELLVFIHFDAKYRVRNISEIFGDSDEDLDQEKTAQREGQYKRGDLLKMHAYRDAIRRSQGAYVLYPGSEKETWEGYREILPGLGAFPVRPTRGGKAVGVRHVEEFIDKHTIENKSRHDLYLKRTRLHRPGKSSILQGSLGYAV